MIVPVCGHLLGAGRPNISSKASSICEVSALGQTREGIERVHLVAQPTVPIIYLSKEFIVGEIDKSIGPGKVELGEKRKKPPNIKRPMV